MQSSLIGKIEKAKRYAQERERISISNFAATFRGEHDSYALSFEKGAFRCSCGFFAGHALCSHSMAMQRILEGMLPVSQAV